MQIRVKERIVQIESVEVISEKLKLNLVPDSTRILRVDPKSDEYFSGTFTFFDSDLGDVEISLRPHAKFQEENVKELFLGISKLIKEVV